MPINTLIILVHLFYCNNKHQFYYLNKQDLLFLCKVVDYTKYNRNKLMSIARTAIKKLKFLGAAIADGQALKGVEKGPSLIRNSRVLDMIRRTEKIEVTDLGDVYTTE